MDNKKLDELTTLFIQRKNLLNQQRDILGRKKGVGGVLIEMKRGTDSHYPYCWINNPDVLDEIISILNNYLQTQINDINHKINDILKPTS